MSVKKNLNLTIEFEEFYSNFGSKYSTKCPCPRCGVKSTLAAPALSKNSNKGSQNFYCKTCKVKLSMEEVQKTYFTTLNAISVVGVVDSSIDDASNNDNKQRSALGPVSSAPVSSAPGPVSNAPVSSAPGLVSPAPVSISSAPGPVPSAPVSSAPTEAPSQTRAEIVLLPANDGICVPGSANNGIPASNLAAPPVHKRELSPQRDSAVKRLREGNMITPLPSECHPEESTGLMVLDPSSETVSSNVSARISDRFAPGKTSLQPDSSVHESAQMRAIDEPLGEGPLDQLRDPMTSAQVGSEEKSPGAPSQEAPVLERFDFTIPTPEMDVVWYKSIFDNLFGVGWKSLLVGKPLDPSTVTAVLKKSLLKPTLLGSVPNSTPVHPLDQSAPAESVKKGAPGTTGGKRRRKKKGSRSKTSSQPQVSVPVRTEDTVETPAVAGVGPSVSQVLKPAEQAVHNDPKPKETWTTVVRKGLNKKAMAAINSVAPQLQAKAAAFLKGPANSLLKATPNLPKPRNKAEEESKLHQIYISGKQVVGFGPTRKGKLPYSVLRKQLDELGIQSNKVKNIQYIGQVIELTVQASAAFPIMNVIKKYKGAITLEENYDPLKVAETSQKSIDRRDRFIASCRYYSQHSKHADIRKFYTRFIETLPGVAPLAAEPTISEPTDVVMTEAEVQPRLC